MVKQNIIEDIGIIVGRFQVHKLHQAHRELINYVRERHKKVVIILGLSPVRSSIRNPLDFAARKNMLNEFGINEVHYIMDNPSDVTWSKNLDKLIQQHYPNWSCRLYGGRDSFIASYSGSYPTEELLQSVWVSGDQERKTISLEHPKNEDFRAGAIWSVLDRFPTSYQTVDILVYDQNTKNILLGKKNGYDSLYRLFGGFVDVKDHSLEDAAIRELKEEAGQNLEVSRPIYIGSRRINDWRYRKENDKIMTALFAVNYLWGAPSPGSDIDEVRWVPVSEIAKYMEPFHLELIQSQIESLNKNVFLAH